MASFRAIVATFVLTIYTASAQIPIPNRPLGFPYGSKGQSLIQLDAFLDLACPDSKTAFPTLNQVADHYGVSNLRLNVLMFPLPFHRTAWLAAQVQYYHPMPHIHTLFNIHDEIKPIRTSDINTSHALISA